MSRSKTAKRIVLDAFQWGAFATPVFVTGVRLAKATVSSHQVPTDYWLLVALIISYVAAATLLIWIPVKLSFQWIKFATFRKGRWCPSMFLYFLLSCVPSTIMILVSIERDPKQDYQSDCVELMTIMIVVTDMTEKLKKFQLRSAFDPGSSTALNEMPEAMHDYQSSVMDYTIRRRSSQNSLIASSRNSSSSSYFVWTDPRPQLLTQVMLNVFDVRLLLCLADDGLVPSAATPAPSVLKSQWFYAVYIIGLVGISTFIVTAKSPYKNLITALLLDFPFFLLRFAYVCHFHHVISLLFFFKNFLVVASLFYFNVARRWAFESETPRFGPVLVNTIERTVSNGPMAYGRVSPGRNSNRTTSQNSFDDDHVINRRSHEDRFNYNAYMLEPGNEAYHGNHVEHQGLSRYEHPNREGYGEPDTDVDLEPGDHGHDYGVYEASTGDHGQEASSYSHDDQLYHQVQASGRSQRETVLRPEIFQPPPVQHDGQQQVDQARHGTDLDGSGEAEGDVGPMGAGDDLYSKINHEAKHRSRKKKAPSAPDAAPLRSSGEPRSSRSSDLLPPLPAPPDFTQVREETGMREVRVGPQRVSVRRDLDFTPDLAAQLAREASNAIAVGAVSEIDHVVQEEDESESSAEDRF